MKNFNPFFVFFFPKDKVTLYKTEQYGCSPNGFYFIRNISGLLWTKEKIQITAAMNGMLLSGFVRSLIKDMYSHTLKSQIPQKRVWLVILCIFCALVSPARGVTLIEEAALSLMYNTFLRKKRTYNSAYLKDSKNTGPFRRKILCSVKTFLCWLVL